MGGLNQERLGMDVEKTNSNFKIIYFAFLFLVFILGSWIIVHYAKRSDVKETIASPAHDNKLYEPQDKLWSILVKEVDTENGKASNLPVTIRRSKTRYSQMKQAVLAFIHGPRSGKFQVPVPEGVDINEFYVTREEIAVVDLTLSNVKKEEFGFYEETLFVRGLIETLSRNFYEIKQVKILVDGQDAPTLCGHYALGTADSASASFTAGKAAR